MITLIVICSLVFIGSISIYLSSAKNEKCKYFSDREVNLIFHAVLIIIIFAYGMVAIDSHKKAQAKCPELTPVKEQLYKIK